MPTDTHIWNFFKAGGAVQVDFKSGADIANLDKLDQKLWTALSCPATGLRFDAGTLSALDTDKDGRIRAPEVLAAVAWLKARLVSLDSILAASNTLPLSSFNTATEEGKALLTAVKEVLKSLGKADAQEISLADAIDAENAFSATAFNGDGIVPPESVAQDAALSATLADILAATGPVTDAGGKEGVDQAHADAFFAAVAARLAWLESAKQDAAVLPLGDGTAKAAAAAAKVAAKVDDYFTRCELAAFDSRYEEKLNGKESDLDKLSDLLLASGTAELETLPIAKVAANRPLPLDSDLNPYWIAAVAALKADAVVPLLGDRATLTRADWAALKAKLAPFAAWQGSEAGKEAAALSAERLAELAKPEAKKAVDAAIAKDLETAPQRALLQDVDKVLRLNANLLTLLKNYVNMGQLYNPELSPIFRVGSLYIDARVCNLCFEVADVGAFAPLAEASKCHLAYCTLKRPGTGATRTICAAVTAGFAQTLWVGRNGVFYDLDGQDWEAVITKIDEHAISLKEAFWAPWQKIAKMISEQINKLLNARNEAVLAKSTTNIAAASDVATGATPPKKMDGAALASSVAAIGIAVGLLGSAVGGLVSTVSKIAIWKSCLGVLAVILVVSLPSVLITWFKLRGRDLAPILNAGGWAINRRLGFSLKLGRLWTKEAKLPPKSKLTLTDPFADKHTGRNVAIILLILAAVGGGLFYRYRQQKWPFGACRSCCAEPQQEQPAQPEAPAPPAAPAAPAGN
ncbi:MAG: hypothetical protein J5985_08480 [Kiritimatiellae bacterium]|nr:hypothetical protein [Kiritimatiellia bacterium]